jgi:hypothetical protein
MTELQASRTLVKSPPELWAECSDAAALARHLGAFGEIRITRLDPETAVAWEGEKVRGTVRIEPAGWGTKVILTAEEAGVPPAVASAAVESVEPAHEAPEPDSEPEAESGSGSESELPEPEPERRRRFARLRAFFRGTEVVVPAPPPAASVPESEAPEGVPEPMPAASAQPEPEPEPSAAPAGATEAALTAALDSLGQAHHRPYSRA